MRAKHRRGYPAPGVEHPAGPGLVPLGWTALRALLWLATGAAAKPLAPRYGAGPPAGPARLAGRSILGAATWPPSQAGLGTFVAPARLVGALRAPCAVQALLSAASARNRPSSDHAFWANARHGLVAATDCVCCAGQLIFRREDRAAAPGGCGHAGCNDIAPNRSMCLPRRKAPCRGPVMDPLTDCQ